MNNPLKILIIEDIVITRERYNRSLNEAFMEKKFADNGLEAFDIYKEWRPDVIILDLFLPELSGYELLKKIRIEENDRNVTVILSTQTTDRDELEECFNLGVQGRLSKPVNIKMLYELKQMLSDLWAAKCKAEC